jgi:hypothetical protein
MNNKLLLSIINKDKNKNKNISGISINKPAIKKPTSIIFINKTGIKNITPTIINYKKSLNKNILLKMIQPPTLILKPKTTLSKQTSKIIETIALKESTLSKINLKQIDNNFIIGITIVNNIPCFSNKLLNLKNKSRADGVLNFIKKVCNIFPKKINCKIAIGLGDSHDCHKEGIMVFSKNKDSKCILIPDLYSMNNYGGKISKRDNIPFSKKINESLFIGATTGSNNPEKNDRLKLCNYALNNKNIKAYINTLCQIPEVKIAKTYPKYKSFLHSSLSIETQIKNKYLINIDGNTCAWDRLPWILNSNSICFKKKSNNKCWYYDLLENNKHYVEFEEPNNITEIMNNLNSNQNRCINIIKNANLFVDEYLNEDALMLYMGNLLYNISLNNKN